MHLSFILSPTACPNQFQCKNQQCIRKELQCDGWSDCGDLSDEINCSKSYVEAEHKLLLSTTSSACIVIALNAFQRVSSPECSADCITCKNKLCKPMFWKCDGVDDCGDNTDEEDCGKNLLEPMGEQLSLHSLLSICLCFVCLCFFFSKVCANQDKWPARTINVFQISNAATEEMIVEMVQTSSTVE